MLSNEVLTIQMSWPVSADRLYTLLMVEARTLTMGWLVTNIPRTNVTAGVTIMDYTQTPAPGSVGPGGA